MNTFFKAILLVGFLLGTRVTLATSLDSLYLEVQSSLESLLEQEKINLSSLNAQTEQLSLDSLQLLIDRLPNSPEKAVVLAYWARTYHNQSKAVASNWLSEAKKIIAQEDDPKAGFYVYRWIGFFHEDLLQKEAAAEAFLKSNSYADRTEITWAKTANHSHLIRIYSTKQKYELAFKYAYDNLEAKLNLEEKNFGYAYAYYMMGTLYEEINDLQESAHQYRLAESAFRELDHREFIGVCIRKQALILNKQNKVDSALLLIQDAQQIFNRTKNNRQIGITNYELGKIYKAKAEYQKATDLFQSALEFVEYSNYYLAIQAELGDNYILAKEFEKAEKLFLALLEDLKKNENPILLPSTYNHLSRLYLEMKDYKKATAYANLAKEEAIQQKLDFKLFESYEYLSQAYFELGEFKKAYAVQKEIANLANITKESVQMDNADHLKLRYQLKSQRDEYERKHEATMQKKAANDRLFLIILVALLIISILSLALIYISKKRNTILAQKNAEIAGLNTTLEEKVLQRTQSLKKSQQDLNYIYNSTQELMGLVSVNEKDDLILDSINQRFIDLLLYNGNITRKQEFEGMLVSDFLRDIVGQREDLIELRMNYIRTVIDSKRPLTYESRTKDASNQLMTFNITLSPVLEESGVCNRVIFVIQDITEKANAQKALQKSEQRLSTIYNSSLDFISLIRVRNPDQFIVETINESMVHFFQRFGLTQNIHELSEISLDEAFTKFLGLDPKEIAAQYELYKRVAIDKKQVNFDYSFQLGDETSYFDITLSPVLDSQKNCTHVLFSGRNITESEKAKQELVISQKRLESIYNATKDYMIVVSVEDDDRLIFEDINQAYKAFWETLQIDYQADQLIGMEVMTFLHQFIGMPEEAIEENMSVFRQVIQYRKVINYEDSYLAPNGEKFFFDISINPILDDADQCHKILFVVRDITAKHLAKEAMISKILETEDRERSRFAKELHDGLGQNLTAASLNFNYVKNGLTELPEEIQNRFKYGIAFLKKAMDESRNMAHNLMPQSILDFGYILTIESLLEDLNQTTDVVFNFYTNLSGQRLPQELEFSLYRITQEAINNILKHAEADTVIIQLIKHTDSVILTIEDNGKGLNNATHNFSSFGLNSMKNRANAHSGVLDIDGRPGKGTSITLEIPV